MRGCAYEAEVMRPLEELASREESMVATWFGEFGFLAAKLRRHRRTDCAESMGCKICCSRAHFLQSHQFRDAIIGEREETPTGKRDE